MMPADACDADGAYPVTGWQANTTARLRFRVLRLSPRIIHRLEVLHGRRHLLNSTLPQASYQNFASLRRGGCSDLIRSSSYSEVSAQWPIIV